MHEFESKLIYFPHKKSTCTVTTVGIVLEGLFSGALSS
jgi:hypothetical protein